MPREVWVYDVTLSYYDLGLILSALDMVRLEPQINPEYHREVGRIRDRLQTMWEYPSVYATKKPEE